MPSSFCPDCGNPLAPRAAFCTTCGRPTADVWGGDGRRRSRVPTPVIVAIVAAVVLVPAGISAVALLHVWRTGTASARMDPRELVDFIEVDETNPPARRDVYGSGELDEAPELLNRDEVTEALTRQYPPLMRDASVEGRVQVQFRIRADGTVDPDHVATVEASHPAFAEAAERVARRMRFRPGRLAGEPVTTEVILPIDFRIAP